jgi:NADH dehydrogenase FAD-containing subunit
VRVEPTLQLIGHDNIFVIGDVIDWNEQKQAAKANVHADLIVPNVLAILQGKTPRNKYKGSMEGIFVSNGKVRFSCLYVAVTRFLI